jgi:nitrogen fixation protein NifU and related proteins
VSDSLGDIYDDHILDHFESPYHKGDCPAATCQHADRNPICGDNIRLQLRVTNGQVEAAYFDGKGCAISQAAASILCEHIEGKTVAELNALTASQMLALLQVPLTASRQKCGLLGFKVLKTLLYTLNPPAAEAPTGS